MLSVDEITSQILLCSFSSKVLNQITFSRLVFFNISSSVLLRADLMISRLLFLNTYDSVFFFSLSALTSDAQIRIA